MVRNLTRKALLLAASIVLVASLLLISTYDLAAQSAKEPGSVNNGQRCTGDEECGSGRCYPGPGDGTFKLCIARSKNCAWPNSDGGMKNDRKVWQGDKVKCIVPSAGGTYRYAYE